MKIQQFVVAYRVDHYRLRAILPEGYESLRPVLRINAELRGEDDPTVYLELNTPVAAFGKRGWLNVAHWETPAADFTWKVEGKHTTFTSPFLTITYTGVGIEGGCPAERDNDGCFYLDRDPNFVPKEEIDQNKEFCDCSLAWRFSPDDAHGASVGGKSVAVLPEEPTTVYPKQPFTAENAAAIPCAAVAGSYRVTFDRAEKNS